MIAAHRIAGALLLGAMTFLFSERPAECHKNHCHGPKIKMCGGGWKDHKVKMQHVGPDSGASSSKAACKAALKELEDKVEAAAPQRCTELHPCHACPSKCTGCKQQNPIGRIRDDRPTKLPKKQADGSWKCKVKAQVAFRCRCGPCLTNKKK